MATSGRIELSVTSTNHITGWIDWSESNVDEANNSSRVTLKLTYKNSGNYRTFSQQSTFYLKVDGNTVATKTDGYTMDRGNTYVVLEKVVTVAHNADGGKSIAISGGGALTGTTGLSASSGTGTAKLTTIPRASTMTVPTTMTMGTAYTFPIKAASSAFTHSISWQFEGTSGTLGGNTWTPPETLAQRIPNADSGTGTLTLTTRNGNATVGSNSYSFTLYCPESMVPTAELTQVSLAQDAAIPAGWDVAVKGFTALQYQASASGVQGSSVSTVRFSCGGATATGTSGTTGVLTASGTCTPTVTVTDSRGRSVTVTDTDIAVYDYGLPTIVSSAAYRCDAQGNAANDGSCIKVLCHGSIYSVGRHNTMTCRCRVRQVRGSWGEYTTLSDNVGMVIVAGLSASASYEVEISVVDSLGSERTVLYTIPTAAVAFNLRAGGTGAAFGKYAEHDNALELPGDWNIRFGDKTLLELVYPVGSIYMSVSSADPAGLFGGTWERIKDVFLLSAGDTYAADATGGEASHTLTEEEMPSHVHSAATSENGAHRHQYGYGQSSGSRAADGAVWNTAGNSSSASEPDAGKNTTQSGAHTHTVTIGNTGDGLAHNNMPPYLVVYVWKRTA